VEASLEETAAGVPAVELVPPEAAAGGGDGGRHGF
jgi:hypothetical protein